MARDPYMERRMLNWVRWKAGAGDVGLGYGSASIWNRVVVDRTPNRDSVIPTNAIEADETDRAIAALPVQLRDTVRVFYLSDERIELKARVLGCAVSTVHARVGEAHRLISVWFSDRSLEAAEQRRKNEAIQANARNARMATALQVELPPAPTAAKRERKHGPVIIHRPAPNRK